jgi:hypothetical protein
MSYDPVTDSLWVADAGNHRLMRFSPEPMEFPE